jgi:hypothetical protein
MKCSHCSAHICDGDWHGCGHARYCNVCCETSCTNGGCPDVLYCEDCEYDVCENCLSQCEICNAEVCNWCRIRGSAACTTCGENVNVCKACKPYFTCRGCDKPFCATHRWWNDCCDRCLCDACGNGAHCDACDKDHCGPCGKFRRGVTECSSCGKEICEECSSSAVGLCDECGRYFCNACLLHHRA